ncbi:unnamed protein product [Larinioides sclopetarius]|uniref:Uncharacterized protein n=1 Tax=Larinioides sclopetarius TaxID=280406 RepID=A0AAV2BFW1_9ARAC
MSGNLKVNTISTDGNQVGTVEMKDSTTHTSYGNIANFKNKAEVGESKIVPTAGIENFGNKHSHRHHFLEAEDEVRDVTNRETTTDSEGKVMIDGVEITDAEAALIEKDLVEDCEGVLSQRRHFPGTTTSHIFG